LYIKNKYIKNPSVVSHLENVSPWVLFMEFLTVALPFLKVISAFGLMLVGIRNRLGLALSILAGGLFMGLVFGLSVPELLRASGLALVQEKFLFLVAIVGSILILSDALERSGQSGRLMEVLSGYLVQPRLRLIFFPALIGLLPMPGGAVFSAPMVKVVSSDMLLGNEDRAVINYWFRHVWEMAWPLYPGIILTVGLADIPITMFISKSWPGVVAMFAIGWFFFLRAGVLNPEAMGEEVGGTRGNCRQVVQEGLPLIIAIAGAVGLETLLARFAPHIPFEWGVIAALVAAIICIMVQNRLGLSFLYAVLKKKSLWTMLMVISAIFIFKDVMQAADIVQEMAANVGGGVALFAAAVFLPFLVGLVAGINVAFVGATFPLLIGLLQSLGMEDQIVPYLILGSFSGFAGVMISPIHICFVLTCNYFETNLAKAWKRLVAPSVCFGLSGALLFWYLV
jgi:integral membrane protein (TIGR00529 family)